MDIENFIGIINRPESQILDFKARYDFSGNNAERRMKQGKFVVDVVSFSNTIRFEPAYIIIGINNEKQLIGIDADWNYRDDAKLQQIVSNFQVDPFPYFIYDEITYENMVFGVIEFPMPKNNRIIGLTKDDDNTYFYGRRGSSNSMLEQHEINDINQWLKKIETINFSKLSGIIENTKINALINKQNIREAKEELEIQIKALNKQKAECEYLDALLCEIQGDNENAKSAYLRALDLDPNNPIYLKELSLIYYELNEYTHAINTFMQLLQIFQYNIGKIDAFLQEEAIKSTSKINKANKAKIDADIGALLFIQGRKSESKDRLKMSYDVLMVEYGDDHPKTKNVMLALEMVDLIPPNIFLGWLDGV